MYFFKKRKKNNVIFKTIIDKSNSLVICDTNVWYELASKNYTKPKKAKLIPTSFSLKELSTSVMMIKHPKYYQDVLRSVYYDGDKIIPENPFDLILKYNDKNYKADITETKELLFTFSEILSKNMVDIKLEDTLIQKIIIDCENCRKPFKEFADIGNDELLNIRRNINVGVGKREHLKENSTEINKIFIKQLFNDYVKSKDYIINWDNFNWKRIELFMIITEIFFNKLETTKGMKIDQNDIVDWFNFLYVSPDDKYLTFEKKWRNYILNDVRIKHYLFC